MTEHLLTRGELEVMAVVWNNPPVTVNDISESIDRELGYTSVLSTVQILEEKAFVRRVGKRGRALLYEPAVSREDVRQSMAGDLTERLFEGSARSLVLSLLDTGSLTREDLDAVRKTIRAMEKRSENSP